MDPKIAKKTQDTLGKYIKKPPLTEKLLAKPPFRFLHDVMTSVIKTTGVMKGLYTDSELNSENVKDRDSKIAFLQKSVDYVCAATSKQLTVKPAKVVAGHEPEKTNEFLQALAQAISSKVDNDEVLDRMNNKGGSSKKEEKEEKSRDREKSSDRRKRDEDKKSRDRGEDKERSRDRDDRHKEKSKDREDRHKEKEDRHKDDRHKDREDRHRDKDRDREREREGRHKSGRSRRKNVVHANKDVASHHTPDDIDTDVLFSDDELDPLFEPGNATYLLDKVPVYSGDSEDESPPCYKPIPRQVSTYQEIRKRKGKDSDELDDANRKVDRNDSRHRIKRPNAARLRRGRADTPLNIAIPAEEPCTPYGSVENSHRGDIDKDYHLNDDMDAVVEALLSKKKKTKSGNNLNDDDDDDLHNSGKINAYPTTSTPKSSPDKSPKKDSKHVPYVNKNTETVKPLYRNKDAALETVNQSPKTVYMPEKRSSKKGMQVNRKSSITEQDMKRTVDVKKQTSKERNERRLEKNDSKTGRQDIGAENTWTSKKEQKHNDVYRVNRRRSRDLGSDDSPSDQYASPKKHRDKVKYRNDDYAHEKMKSKHHEEYLSDKTDSDQKLDRSDTKEVYYKKKRSHGIGDRRKRSSFTSISDNRQQRREEEGKENDAPKENMVNGDHKPSDAPAKMQRPSSAKGSRRRMEGGNLSSDEDVPAQRQEPTLGEDDLPPQVTGRLARPSSARPAPPKRKEDTVQSEPAMRLGSGKPQNLILDDGKDSDEDETFVVEDAQPQLEEPIEQQSAPLADEDDEDHGGLVKKIMESKKEYEQPRETKIDRPTISDAQRRKQREAVQREIDKLRGSIQTLTRSANPLGKIMDYVQEDLDSMQKELEKWKEENKEHGLALKREKAITERAVEPLRVQLSEVDQAIKDQLDLIGAVKSNIIRNDQKIEKMLRTIAKS
ncbi:TRAF3-interacting protein 1-like isoform X3 [Ruditapes philippinarum]|uniref:TRAF3-interacting protein 1-like isoform X3 n=1 Tax=Ruditapes philippinarum TaxID=129788 RepID=UPI00295C2D73|nr:TRAF3-interacting protein 1-like isoform X3 [Ruditapes philippinarum]